MLSSWLNWMSSSSPLIRNSDRLVTKLLSWARCQLKIVHAFLFQPWNLPLLAGLAFVALGLLLMIWSIKSPWYKIPHQLEQAQVTDEFELEQSKLPPTRRKPDLMTVQSLTSKFEFPAKAVLVVTLCTAGIYIVRSRFRAAQRANALGAVASIGLIVGLSFAHLVIVDEPELSHTAAWIYSQHDELAWYGGDIYTSREYEIPGGAYDIMMKDSPRFIAVVTPPYVDLDLASINDFLTWAGMCPAFWCFVSKGWSSMMLGCLLLFVGVLCTRTPGKTRGLSKEIVQSVMIRAGLIFTPWFVVITGRALLVAWTLDAAQDAYERGDVDRSLQTMQAYRYYMPCLEYDSGLMLQEGILEYSSGVAGDRANFAEAFLLEANGCPLQAEKIYFKLMDSKLNCVARESARYVLRRAIINFNAGEEEDALQLVEAFRQRYPYMPKAAYLRLLLAVRADDFAMAQHCLQEIYAVVRSVGIPEARGYCTSGHQHLAQLAYDQGDLVETRRQIIYRAEQQPKK